MFFTSVFRRNPYIPISVVGAGILLVTVINDFEFVDTVNDLRRFGVLGTIACGVISYLIILTLTIHDAHVMYSDWPQPPRASFFAGNWDTMAAAQKTNTLFDLLEKWVIEHGKTILFWRFSAAKFFTVDPDVVRYLLTEISLFKKSNFIPNRSLFGKRMTGTNSFLTITGGPEWATKRKLMSPYFSKIHLTGMFDNCHDFIHRGLDKQFSEIKIGETHVDIVEFYGELYQYFLGALGFDLDCEFVSSNAKFHNQVIQGILKWAPQQFGSYKETLGMRMSGEVNEVICNVAKLRNICREIVDVKRQEVKDLGGPKPDDILHHVINANVMNKKSMKHKTAEMTTNMIDDIFTIFLVIDNMGKTLSNMMVRVMREPRVYQKMVEEIRQADLTSLQSMDKSLPYTEMVILEALRLHPTLMRGIRAITKAGTPITKDLIAKERGMIFFGHLVLHRLPEYWKNPRDFIPERWENGSKNITPFTYLPFVAGPRVCMGKHLAMLSMKLALVYTFKEYDMRPIPGEEKVMDWDYRFTIVRPTKGYHVIFDKLKVN